jgi:uncharacterized protein with HEPN domain
MFMDDSVRLRHLLDAAREAVSLCERRTRQDLDADRMLNLSLVRLLEIIGEAAAGVSDEFKESHSSIPWHQMTAMRNRLIHGYFDVNMDVVWQTIQNDLPPLIGKINSIV